MSNDLISRDDLKEAMRKAKRGHYSAFSDITLQSIYRVIDNAPTVEIDKLILIVAKRSGKREMMLNALRPQGTWDYEQVALYGVCSNCGVAVTSNLADMFLYEEIGKCPYNTNFCPNCGADMRKGGTE